MWHEARRSERKVHDLMDAARKRAQRRAVFLAKRRGDPQQSLQVVGSRCRVHRDDGLYQASEDQQGLIPWNAKQDILIDRFDGRALLDFIRDSDSRRFRPQQKTEEEEELEEFVNFERYRDLIKHRRRGFSDEDGILHANQEMEARVTAPFASERPKTSQSSVSKATYSQVGFSYSGDGNEETNEDSEDDDGEEDGDDDEKEFSSDDSNDEGLEAIAKDFGVKRYNWLLFMDKKAKEEERLQKEIIKGDPSVRKLSRKERRKASQIERERDREATRTIGRVYHNDPYRGIRRSPTYDAYPRSQRSRSRSRSRSPSYSRRHDRGHADNGHRSRSKPSKIEYITEFGGSTDLDVQKLGGYSPPSSPLLHASPVNRSGNSTFNICKDRDNLLFSADTLVLLGSWVPKADYQSGLILEALHTDPASAVSVEQENSNRLTKPSVLPSTSSATAKLNKTTNGGPLKSQQAEKKETPQERLKRIMSKQLNKQIKKDSVAEMAKKREQERLRQEKLEETSRLARLRYRSPSRSHSRSPRRHRYSRSRSGSRSPRRYRSSSHSRSPRARGRSRH